MTKILALTLAVFFLFSTPSRAEFQGPEVENWDDETSVLLARALVSEADWSSTDHAAIAWTLYRRWKARREQEPTWTYKDQILAYCSGMKGEARTQRHRWVRALPANGVDKPEDWPENVSWTVYQRQWARVLQFTTAWYEGRVKDPCKGRSLHWGAPYGTDLHRPKVYGWEPVNCGPTARNLFWRPKKN